MNEEKFVPFMLGIVTDTDGYVEFMQELTNMQQRGEEICYVIGKKTKSNEIAMVKMMGNNIDE